MMKKLSNPTQEEWITMLEGHITHRPQLMPIDVYKLLFQGFLGPEHLVASPSAFAEYLQAEYAALEAGRDDPLLESIHPHDRLLRINLRPFKAEGLELDRLVKACIQTARQDWGAPEELRILWSSFTSSYHKRPLAAFTPEEVDALSDWLASQNYPAVHHSPAYRRAYQPAYRLVAAEFAGQFTL